MKKAVQSVMFALLALALADPASAQDSQHRGAGYGYGYSYGQGQGAGVGVGTTKVYREGNNWVEEVSGTLPASRTVNLNTEMGSIQVHGAAQNTITYVIRKKLNRYSSSEDRARAELAAFRVSAARRGDTAYFQGEWEGGSGRRMSAEFQIMVPRETSLVKADTSGGSVDIGSLNGRVEAETGGGSIRLDDIAGNATASSGGGSVDVGNMGGDVALETGGGSINVRNVKGKASTSSGGGSIRIESVNQTATVETGGGSIEVAKCGAHLRASTGGGSLDIGYVSGPVELETGGGGIRLGGASGTVRAESGGGTIELWKVSRGVQVETGAGGITVEFVTPRGQLTDSRLETGAGDLIVYLPEDLGVNVRANVEMATGSRGIHSDFSGIKVNTENNGGYGPREMWAEGNLNGGGPMLKLHTVTGNIEIRKGKR